MKADDASSEVCEPSFYSLDQLELLETIGAAADPMLINPGCYRYRELRPRAFGARQAQREILRVEDYEKGAAGQTEASRAHPQRARCPAGDSPPFPRQSVRRRLSDFAL